MIALTERIIALLAGESGVGKSFFVANLKKSLIYDTDIGGGLAYADERIKRNGSERVEVGSYLEILDDLKKRQQARTLDRWVCIVIDHLSGLHQEACIRHNPKDERDFGRSSDIATREWRRVRHFARNGDFNLVVCAHLKAKWENEKAVGLIADGGKNLEGDFQQVLEIRRSNKYPSTAWVKKWRRDPEDVRGLIPNIFDFSVERFEQLAGGGLTEPRKPIVLASESQVKELLGLLEIAKLPEGTLEKWQKNSGTEAIAEWSGDDIAKRLDYIKGLLNPPAPRNPNRRKESKWPSPMIRRTRASAWKWGTTMPSLSRSKTPQASVGAQCSSWSGTCLSAAAIGKSANISSTRPVCGSSSASRKRGACSRSLRSAVST